MRFESGEDITLKAPLMAQAHGSRPPACSRMVESPSGNGMPRAIETGAIRIRAIADFNPKESAPAERMTGERKAI